MVAGVALVLASWSVCVAVLATLGLPTALLLSRGPSAFNPSTVLRHAGWWGLITVTLFAYAANLVWPLGSASTSVALGLLLVVAGVLGWVLFIRRTRGRSGRTRSRPRRLGWWWTLFAALTAAQLFLALAALGPVTNYDSGLYHLGAIAYAREFPTIPGLANLYFPFGYGNAEFPLAALAGNGPWGAEGYRLLNGLVMLLAALDLGLRIARRRGAPGTWVLLVGVVAAWVPLIALVDYWVTSPTQDSSVFVVTLVASAYLADAVLGRRDWTASAATALGLGVLLVLLRPTMVVYLAVSAACVVVLAVRLSRARPPDVPGRVRFAGVVVAVTAVLAGLVATARDALLSGWVQYPLSILPLDVPWRAADPAPQRLATLGFHRDPSTMWESAEGWGWVGRWLARLPAQWETYELALLALVAVALLALAARTGRGGRWPAMLLSAAPAVAAALAWWLWTPPSFRFGWGPLVALWAIPAGWSLWRLTRRPIATRKRWAMAGLVGATVPVLAVTVVTVAARFDPGGLTEARTWSLGVQIPYRVAPVARPLVTPDLLPSGLAITRPVESDQCWTEWPMCTPDPSPGLRLRGETFDAGLLP